MLCRAVLFCVDLGFEDAYVGKRAVLFRIVETEADHKFVGDGHAAVIRREFHLAAGGLVEQGAGAHALCALELQIVAEVGERSAAVDDVLDDEHRCVL